ncbi:MAG: hypothetical protein KF832_24885 [Caldilineaceae bacterium]|nr:hypothetical protein [Caldilineaceae bacterium]
MQSISLNLPSGELSPREQAIAELAVKISSTPRLTNGARLDHLRAHNLEEEEINTVLKLATVYRYWHEHNQVAQPEPHAVGVNDRPRLSLDGDPAYYFEGTSPVSYEGH